AVDLPAGLVYGTFGQPYTEPASVTACHAAHGGFTESCEQPGSYLKSVVAFDLKTGEPQWSYRVQGRGPWLQACGGQPPTVTWCAPESDGEKWDIGGSGVNVMRLRMDGHWRDVVGLGGKSGVYTLLDAKTGEFIWNTLIGPGGDQGGMEWGTAFDGNRIYASITNHHHIPYKLTENGVITNLTATGAILWQFGAGSSVNSGPAVVNGTVYWGSGYSRSGVEGSGNRQLFAFSIDGR